MAALILSIATLVSASAARCDGPQETPAQLVDDLHSAFGVHHARAVHAKGILLEGEFMPSSEARRVCKALVFAGAAVPVTIRFSDFTGIPDIPDTVGDANPRGLALKFQLADGTKMDIVGHSFNGFPTATADEFGQLLRAIAASGAQAAKPTPLELFLAGHPTAKTFLTTQKPAPVSYATLAYFGVNSFKFTDARNKSIYVRYRFVPKIGEQFLDAASLKSKGPNYLSEEIAVRIAKGAFVYEWFAQVSEQGDAIADPSSVWPDSRKLIKLGTLTINRLVADQAAADKAALFLPTNVPAGIEPADPMLAIRSAAYPLSYANRQ